ncbi:helix-turn-helix domain-containing protein, partial [uncultured Nonlabens sp.]|uniref:helix-turn-helix domain-containing protein n=1 Tax=uncultured Nonlabens sp. TaxID=859306 RepID=UPI0026230102
SLKKEKRLKSLLLIKSGKFKTRQEVADSVFVHIRTLERWLSNYKEGGIELMIADKPKNKGSKIITREMHNALSNRV